MSDNCVNINSEEFKSLSSEFTNTPLKVLAAKVSLWQDTYGIDKFPSKQDLLDNEKAFKELARKSTAKVHPVLSSKEVSEVTSNLLYIGLNDVKELSNVEEQLNVPKIEKQLILQLKKILADDTLSQEEKQEMVSRYKYILDDNYKLLDFWKNKMVNHIKDNFKLNSLKKIDEVDPELEEDENGNNEGINIIENYHKSHFSSATTNIRYILGTTPDISAYENGKIIYNKGKFLGLPKFIDSSVLWANISETLKNSVQIDVEGVTEDGFKTMITKLRSHSKFKPELAFVADKVDKMSDNVKTQFFSAFAKQKANYIDHVIDTSNDRVVSKITDSNDESKEYAILSSWDAEFQKIFGELNENDVLVYNTSKIEEFKRLITTYNESFTNDYKSKDPVLNPKTLDLLNKVYSFLGIELNKNTISSILFNTSEGDTPRQFMFALRQHNLQLYNTLNTIKNIQPNTELTDKNNLILDNKSFYKNILASADAYFTKVKGEDSFIGADGNRTFLTQNHNTLTMRISEFKEGDLTYLEDLQKNDFSSNSVWVNTALDPEHGNTFRQSMYIAPYGNFRVKGEDIIDKGDKASSLNPSETFTHNLNVQLQGYFIGLAEADKGQQNYIAGPEVIKSFLTVYNNKLSFTHVDNDVSRIFLGYLSAELKRMNTAWEAMYGENKLDEKDQILYYHTDGKGNPGNAFKSFLFPQLKLVELGLVAESINGIPGRVDLNKISIDALAQNKNVLNEINNTLISLIKDDISQALKYNTIKYIYPNENDKSVKYLANNFISIEALKDRGYGVYTGDVNKLYETNQMAITNAIADYTINSIIGNIEQTMMFNLDPALYKVKLQKETLKDDNGKPILDENGKEQEVEKPWEQQDMFADFKKRIPAVAANGILPRIFTDSQGIVAVRPHYYSATISNIEVGSSYYTTKDDNGKVIFNEDVINNISKVTGENPKNIKKLLKPYLEINQTDAQAWITLDAYRERMRAYGKWGQEHENAYNKIQNEEELTINDKAILAQPLKTVHVEAKKHHQNVMMMHYNKQSEAVLLPFLTKGTQLDNLRLAMEAQKVDHVIVLDGKKVGATGIIDVTNENGDIKPHTDIQFNPVKLSYKRLFLQQDLSPHGIENRLLGSQVVKNVMGVVSKNAEGMQLIHDYHNAKSKISNLKLEKFKKKLGFDNITKIFKKDDLGNSPLYETILKESYDQLSDNHIDALRDETILDALPIKNPLQNKLNSMLTKAAIKLPQLGGTLVQMSNFGMIGLENNDKISIKGFDLNAKVGDGIIWFKDPRDPLQPMRIENDTVKPAQVLIPLAKLLQDPKFHKIVKNKFGVDSYKKLTHNQFKEVINISVLEGLSYRIPNQGPSSNDAFEIVGILPAEVGDTIISFSDITTKTGSDFDIDKSFIILPNYYYDEKANKIKTVKYNPENETLEGLENHVLDLMRGFLLHPDAYLSVMSPLDDPWLSDLCGVLYPEKNTSSNLKFFQGTVQADNKNVFDTAKSLVGVIANHMSSHPLFLHEDISFKNYYLGLGNFISPSKNISTNENKSVTLTDDLWNVLIQKDPELTKDIWNSLSNIEQIRILNCI